MEDELRSEYDLKSLRVRRLGSERKSFGGTSIREESILMATRYEQLCQSYNVMLDSFSSHKEEAQNLFRQFLNNFANYLGCSVDHFTLINPKGHIVDDVIDAIDLTDELLPWTLWFAINIEGQHLQLINQEAVVRGRFGIRIKAWKRENFWELQVAEQEQTFTNADNFTAINNFIYERSLKDVNSYFDRFLKFSSEGDDKPRLFGFGISPIQ